MTFAPAVLTLDEHAARLLAWVRTRHEVPPYQTILVLDTREPGVRYAAGADHGWRLPAQTLHPLRDFAARFDALLRRGYAWVNLSLYGLHGGALVLGVEYPHEPTGIPPGRTSVNYSGPGIASSGEPLWELPLERDG